MWGLLHTYAPLARPTGNAVVERVIRALKDEIIWLRHWESADELRVAVADWLRHYKTPHPHQALDWQPPAERRIERLVHQPVLWRGTVSAATERVLGSVNQRGLTSETVIRGY